LKLLHGENITLFFGVPAIFLFLIQHPDFRPEAFDKVRLVMSGGAPLPVNLVRQYHEAGIILQQGFGMSEAAPSISTLSKDLALKKAGSIGRAVFHLEARVVDDDMNDVPVGEVGELVMRGPNMMQGYWNRPEETAAALRNGWLHTGDIARLDREGFLYIMDRKKDMIISGGENVYPREVEEVLYRHPAVLETAVIGIPDPYWVERVHAVVATKKGASTTAEELIAFCKKQIASYKAPKSVEFVDALPKNPAGKILKRELREKYWKGTRKKT